jgi:hypothetical protein
MYPSEAYASANGLTKETVNYLVGKGLLAYEDWLMSMIHSCVTEISNSATSGRQE